MKRAVREAALGRRVSFEIAGISYTSLLELFYDCHTFCFDGGLKPHKTSKNKQVRTGYWLRTAWPDSSSLLEQNNLIVEAFRIIMHEQEQLY